jgi:hypothetical protein
MATELPLLTGLLVYLICAAFGGPRRPPVAPLHLAAEWRANEILRSRIIPPAPGTPESPGGLGTRSEPGTWGAGPRAGAGTLFPSTFHPPPTTPQTAPFPLNPQAFWTSGGAACTLPEHPGCRPTKDPRTIQTPAPKRPKVEAVVLQQRPARPAIFSTVIESGRQHKKKRQSKSTSRCRNRRRCRSQCRCSAEPTVEVPVPQLLPAQTSRGND